MTRAEATYYLHRVGLVGNITWVAYVIMSGTARGLLLVCVPMAMVNIRNYCKWGTTCQETHLGRMNTRNY